MRLVDNIIFLFIQVTMIVCWIISNMKMKKELIHGSKGMALLQFVIVNGMMLYLVVSSYTELMNFGNLIDLENGLNQIIIGVLLFSLIVFVFLINGNIGKQLMAKNKEGQVSAMLTTVFVTIVAITVICEVPWRLQWII